MPSFTHSVKDLIPGWYPLVWRGQSVSQNAPINATTTFTITTPTGVTARQGYVRFRISAYPGAGAGQVTKVKITGTDGVTTVVLSILASFDASDLADVTRAFCTDLGINSISFIVTMANVVNGQATVDMEIGANA